MMGTGIEWTDETWNPVTGCDRVSEGCDNCYAAAMAARLAGRYGYPATDPFAVTLHPDRLDEPARWRRPRRIFVCSMADLFHRDVPPGFIVEVFARMLVTPQHTYQVLTKRPRAMARLLADPKFDDEVAYRVDDWLDNPVAGVDLGPWLDAEQRVTAGGPLFPNVWCGTSIELNKHTWRTRRLARTAAAVRWLSLEPLLGSLPSLDLVGIDWVVAGGESGPRARPMHPDWVRAIRDRCQAAQVPFLFKQWGTWAPLAPVYDQAGNSDVVVEGHDRTRIVAVDNTGHIVATLAGPGRNLPELPPPEGSPWWMARVGKKAAGRQLDGRSWDQYPDDGAAA